MEFKLISFYVFLFVLMGWWWVFCTRWWMYSGTFLSRRYSYSDRMLRWYVRDCATGCWMLELYSRVSEDQQRIWILIYTWRFLAGMCDACFRLIFLYFRHYCVAGTTLPISCPAGYFCPESTGPVWQSCPPGTYSNTTGLASEPECTDCTAGKLTLYFQV